MKVSDVMTRHPACCSPDTKLPEIAALMVEHDCGAIPVCENDKPVGIITDRDITVRAVAQGKNPADLTARDCMTAPVSTIHEDASLDDALDILEDMAIRRIVVVDDAGKICGIVAQADVAEVSEDEAGEMVQAVSQQPPSPHPTGDGVRAPH